MFKFLRRKLSGASPETGGTAGGNSGDDDGMPTPGAGRADAETMLQRLEWTVIRRLDGLLQGDYRTLLRGFGLDLADLREYQAHDDVRYIDWNVTARMQVPHVREFQEDREVTAFFVCDLSGSVDFGSQQLRKRELSAGFVGVLARLLTRHGNRVGALLHGQDAKVPEQFIPARGGRRQVLHLLDRIEQMRAPEPPEMTAAEKKAARRAAKGKPAQPLGKETDLSTLLTGALQMIRRRSVVFVVSDFISKPGWDQALALLARKHEVVCVRIYDPMEQTLPEVGLVVMQDAETGEQLLVDTQDRAFRERFAAHAKARETALRSALADAGVDCLELATTDDLQHSLLRFIDLRKRRSRLSAGGGLRPALLGELRA